MKLNLMRNVTALLMLGTSAVLVHPVTAATTSEEAAANVHFVATLNNGPAMRPVKWTLYRLSNNNEATYYDSFNRHSASMPLPPGRYRAEVSLKDVSRFRVFDVSSVTSSIVVPMD